MGSKNMSLLRSAKVAQKLKLFYDTLKSAKEKKRP